MALFKKFGFFKHFTSIYLLTLSLKINILRHIVKNITSLLKIKYLRPLNRRKIPGSKPGKNSFKFSLVQ